MDQKPLECTELERPCKVCKVVKPVQEFNFSSRGERFRRHECRSCESTRKKRWYAENMVSVQVKMRAAYERRKAAGYVQSEEDRKVKAQYAKRWRLKAQDEVFEHYGGYKCACCGETERKFLTLDHTNNDGYARHRYGGEPRGAAQLYGWLRKMGYPEGFQVLCMNCNFGKSKNGGICPHQEGSTTRA